MTPLLTVLMMEYILVLVQLPALFVHLSESQDELMNGFCKQVIQFYQHFLQKQIKKFDFKSKLFHILSLLDPVNSRGVKQYTFDQIDEILPVTFDKLAVKLAHREFVVDYDVHFTDTNAVRFWVNVHNMKSPMGAHKYRNLAIIALKLLAISTSNADCERVFSHARRIKTDFDHLYLQIRYLL